MTEFLNLPSEIRAVIFGLALEKCVIKVCLRRRSKRTAKVATAFPGPTQIGIPLLLVNKEISQQVSAIMMTSITVHMTARQYVPPDLQLISHHFSSTPQLAQLRSLACPNWIIRSIKSIVIMCPFLCSVLFYFDPGNWNPSMSRHNASVAAAGKDVPRRIMLHTRSKLKVAAEYLSELDPPVTRRIKVLYQHVFEKEAWTFQSLFEPGKSTLDFTNVSSEYGWFLPVT